MREIVSDALVPAPRLTKVEVRLVAANRPPPSDPWTGASSSCSPPRGRAMGQRIDRVVQQHQGGSDVLGESGLGPLTELPGGRRHVAD
jgi:hypothetical protein